MRKKMITASVLVLFVALCSLSFAEEPKPKNLKVLSKNISHDDLDKIMKGFKNALGVKCSFCHAQSKVDPKKLDFASDENDHKLIARDMMRMTMKINKKYFRNKDNKQEAISCYTCHRGNEEPKFEP